MVKVTYLPASVEVPSVPSDWMVVFGGRCKEEEEEEEEEGEEEWMCILSSG
jgi:hypothetical protein